MKPVRPSKLSGSRRRVADVAASLDREFAWLTHILDRRIKAHFAMQSFAIEEVPPPALAADSPPGTHEHLILRHAMQPPERCTLALALAPALRPHLLDILFQKNPHTDRGFTEFGGIKGVNHSGFIPTGETALFLLAGDGLEKRLEYFPILHRDHYLFTERLLDHQAVARGEPPASIVLSPTPALLGLLVTGELQKPDFSGEFPASRIRSELGWDDLVLEPSVLQELREVRTWARHGGTLLNDWGLRRHLKPGFRALFHGPSGTGKTLTACLLGQESGVDVYRIDLSQIVSKYIGETEKNLANIFSQAERKNWILFFDEADALFGKRTRTATANDRYANQETAYLLQRIEDHPGIVILASNLRSNLDDAFARRFQASIYFPPPDAPQRLRLWRNILPRHIQLEPAVDLPRLAEQHPLTGGQMVNVVRHCCLMAIDRGESTIRQADLVRGISRELEKEGRVR